MCTLPQVSSTTGIILLVDELLSAALPCISSNLPFTLASPDREPDAAPVEKGAKTARGKLCRAGVEHKKLRRRQWKSQQQLQRHTLSAQSLFNEMNSNCEVQRNTNCIGALQPLESVAAKKASSRYTRGQLFQNNDSTGHFETNNFTTFASSSHIRAQIARM